MSGQSKEVYHIYAKPPFSDFMEIDSGLDCEFDDRDKIEDLENFKRYIRNEMDEAQYTRFLGNLETYLKFYND